MKRYGTGLWAMLILLGLCPSLSIGQLFKQKSIDVKFVPEAASVGAVTFPKVLATDPKFDLFPREIVTAWGQKEFGFDPMKLTQVTFVAVAPKGMMGLQQGPPAWAMVLHFEEMQGLSGVQIDRLKKTRMNQRMLFSGKDTGEPSFLVYDEATIFVGEESLFEPMMTADGKSQLAKLMKGSKHQGQALAFVDIETMRPLLNEAMGQIPGLMPPAITKLKRLPDMLKGIEMSAALEGTLKTKISLHFVDVEAAEKGEKIIADAMELGKEMAIGGAAMQFDSDDPIQAATLEYMQRMGDEYEGRLAPTLSGSNVSISIANEAAVAPFMVGLLLPAVQQARTAARRTQSMNNLRQMALAAHNYADANGGFPAQASFNKKGKPLLSWRVHILPYIEQQALYEQFHLDEPWDSPHNLTLLEKMPMAFQSPSVALPRGKTVYLGIAGERAVFGKQKRKFSQITDGTSNTALMVEVDPSMAVEWTRPKDYEMDPRQPLKGLGGVNPGGFLVSLADGSTHFVSNSISPETWKALTTIANGEVIDSSDFQP